MPRYPFCPLGFEKGPRPRESAAQTIVFSVQGISLATSTLDDGLSRDTTEDQAVEDDERAETHRTVHARGDLTRGEQFRNGAAVPVEYTRAPVYFYAAQCVVERKVRF